MTIIGAKWCLTLLLLSGLLAGAFAQPGHDPAKLIAAQKEALSKLAVLDGEWRGAAWILTPTGKHTITQTERVGPFLDGSVRVIEGKGYEADGTESFNALGIISFDVATGSYSMRSYAQGRAGDFPVTLTEDGFEWEIEAGPMTIKYKAVVKDGKWTETGVRVMPNQEPVPFFEMTLTRIGDSRWPAAGAVARE